MLAGTSTETTQRVWMIIFLGILYIYHNTWHMVVEGLECSEGAVNLLLYIRPLYLRTYLSFIRLFPGVNEEFWSKTISNNNCIWFHSIELFNPWWKLVLPPLLCLHEEACVNGVISPHFVILWAAFWRIGGLLSSWRGLRLMVVSRLVDIQREWCGCGGSSGVASHDRRV